MSNDFHERQNQPSKVHLLSQLGDLPLKIDTTALVSDGTLLAIAAPGSGISIWNLISSLRQNSLEIPDEDFRQPDPAALRDLLPWTPVMVRTLSFTDDGSFIAAAFTNGEVGLWLSEGTLLETITCPVVDLLFFPQTHLLALCRENGWVEVWETMPARQRAVFKGTPNLSTSGQLSRCRLACSLDGTQLAVIATFSAGRIFSSVSLWSLGTMKPLLHRTLPGFPGFINHASYLSPQHQLYCYNQADSFWKMDTDTGHVRSLLPESINQLQMRALCGSPDGKMFAMADMDGKVSIYDVSTQQAILSFQAHTRVEESIEAVSGILWSPDGKRLTTVGTSRVGEDLTKSDTDKKLLPSLKHNTIKIWRFEY